MKKTEQNIFMEWLKSNLITLVVLASGMLLAWAALNARVEAIEAKVSQYPSQDWFELKFETIQKGIDENKKAIQTTNQTLQSLPSKVETALEK